MIRYTITRITSLIPVVGVVTAVVFGLTYLSPGDPAAIMAGDYATPAQIEAIRERLQLDAPVVTRYLQWLGDALQGNLGRSLFSGQPVLKLILSRIEPTIMLATTSTLIALVVSVPLGLLAAHRPGTALDRFVLLFCVAGMSVPAFLIGYALIFTFGVSLGLLPVQGFAGVDQGIGELVRHVILPSIMLGLTQTALMARITRASAIEIFNQDFIRVARAKGLNEFTIIVRHCLRLVAIPIVTIVGTSFAALLGGVVITETVFAIPGVGRLLVDAIQHKDIPVIQGILLLSAMVYVIMNLLVDLAYPIIDRRIQYT
ncbi:ABC transporter permease [Mesorhizobium sp. VK4C]|uniref:ABC transporter permease n=1 Tax=Mesorhizobium captivum TaxID=3072319 RepID=UPI002A241070|nr:ABC transporter permease [Mesorhizobium sp. VK4C]MDX8499045.1 ABC transporter permease [Mesorhizobium sp. VK4C]